MAEHDFATPPLAVWPVTLEGDIVRLEPLSPDHLAPLAAVGLDERLWRWIPWPIRTGEDLAAYVQTALDGLAARTVLPFATVETGRLRHSAYYSITDDDWPDVRAGLVGRIARIERKAHESQDRSDPKGAGSPAV